MLQSQTTIQGEAAWKGPCVLTMEAANTEKAASEEAAVKEAAANGAAAKEEDEWAEA
jgi:hypothetical protein